MKISLSKKLLKIIFLIFVFKDIFPSNFSIFSDGVNVAYSQIKFFIREKLNQCKYKII